MQTRIWHTVTVLFRSGNRLSGSFRDRGDFEAFVDQVLDRRAGVVRARMLFRNSENVICTRLVAVHPDNVEGVRVDVEEHVEYVGVDTGGGA